MGVGTYGILIIFGLFIILLVSNPKLSCFGKRIRSPFYPLSRKKKMQAQKKVKSEDYGFKLAEGESRGETAGKSDPKKKVDDDGLRLD